MFRNRWVAAFLISSLVPINFQKKVGIVQNTILHDIISSNTILMNVSRILISSQELKKKASIKEIQPAVFYVVSSRAVIACF